MCRFNFNTGMALDYCREEWQLQKDKRNLDGALK